jgi:hypothetical protein
MTKASFEKYCWLVSVVAAIVIASAAPGVGEPANNGNLGGNQKCTVTDGPNKGKKGTYSIEADGLNCSGSWGATGCINADASSKCKAGVKIGNGAKPVNVGGLKTDAPPPKAKQAPVQPVKVEGTKAGHK